MTTRTARLAPAPIDPRFADWVYVYRLAGVFDGPLYRKPTAAEVSAAIRAGATMTSVANRLRMPSDRMRAILHGLPVAQVPA